MIQHKPLSRRRELWLLFTLAGIQFTHILDFMIMMPLGPEFTTLFGISDAQFGLLVSAYTLAAGASGLLASTYIDRFGRKRLLLTLYALFALATLACGLAPTYAALMVARVAAGVFGGVLSALCQTIVGDVIPFERRGRAMGIVMTSFSVSTVAGVPCGLFLAAHLGWHAPFIAIAALSMLLAAFAASTLPTLDDHLRRLQQHQPENARPGQIDVRADAPRNFDEVDQHDQGGDDPEGDAQGPGLLDQNIAFDPAESEPGYGQCGATGHANRAFIRS